MGPTIISDLILVQEPRGNLIAKAFKGHILPESGFRLPDLGSAGMSEQRERAILALVDAVFIILTHAYAAGRRSNKPTGLRLR